MRAKGASKSIDSPGESGKQSWRGGFVPLARVSSQGPFFRVSVGEMHFIGFPFGLHRKGPFLGLFVALSDGASRDVIARMGGRFVPPAQG